MFKRPRFRSLIVILAVAATLAMPVAVSASPPIGGPVVSTPAEAAPPLQLYGGVRFRSFNSGLTLEVFQGTDLNPPSEPGTLITQNLTWRRSNQIRISYDPAAHTLISQVNNNPELVFENFVPDGPINYARIVVVEHDPTGQVDFVHVKLDTYRLGDFTTDTPNPQAGCFTLNSGDPLNSWCSWGVSDYNFSQGFTMKGKIDLDGTFPSIDPETTKVEIMVGYLAE